jgi:hypothetical protein
MIHHRVKNIIKLGVEFKQYLCHHHSKISFSQEGEDLILARIFSTQAKGFYVDIGAHHPFRFSNTWLFYKKGWNGINIDPMPGIMKIFNIFRSRDLNLELSISNTKEESTYFMLSDPALNGFSKQLTEERVVKGTCQLRATKKLKSCTLKEIFDNYLEEDSIIDFMSIDVEGVEYSVVRSNNWKSYRPKIILVEILNKTLDELQNDKTALFLKDQGYLFFSKTVGTCFFVKEEYFNERFSQKT